MKKFVVAKVEPDGNCLFWALALHEQTQDAESLREELSDFMEQTAMQQHAFEEAFLEEAEHLRGPKNTNWGGNVSITAYSLMRQVHVFVHTAPEGVGFAHVADYSHESLQSNPNARSIHLLWNGDNHYDGLVEMEDTSVYVEAWPQPPPPVYFKEPSATSTAAAPQEDFPPLPADGGARRRKRVKFAAPRSSKKCKQNCCDGIAAGGQKRASADPSQDWQPVRRCRKKTTPPPSLQENNLDIVVKARIAAKSEHPHRQTEDQIKARMGHQQEGPHSAKHYVLSKKTFLMLQCVECRVSVLHVVLPWAMFWFYSCPALSICMQALAVERLREDPTTPPDCTRGMADAGMLWPRAFCAFKGCSWSKMHGTDSDLHCHLEEAHAEELEPIARTMLRNSDKDRLLSVYSAAVTYHCRRQAPLAGASLDRRALMAFSEATSGDGVEALVCFCCGCVHPCVREVEASGHIRWCKPLANCGGDPEEPRFLGKPLDIIAKLLGLDTYLSKYDWVGTNAGDNIFKLSALETFEDWHLSLPDCNNVKLLCCPEAGAFLLCHVMKMKNFNAKLFDLCSKSFGPLSFHS